MARGSQTRGRCKIPPPPSMSSLASDVTQMPSSFIYPSLLLLLSIPRSHLMAGYGGGQCNRRRVSDKAGLWHGPLISCRIILPLSMSMSMSFEWPRPAQHFSEGRGRFIRIRITFPQCLGWGTSAAQTELFAKFVSKGLASKIDICMYGVSHSGQPFASHVLEKLDSKFQQQKEGFRRQLRANLHRRLRGTKASTCSKLDN